MVLVACRFPAPMWKFLLFHNTCLSPMCTQVEVASLLQPSGPVCSCLPRNPGSYSIFVTVRWQWPGHEQNHKHLSSISFIFQNTFIRCYFISTLPSIISSVCELRCRYPTHRITVSNPISAPVALCTNLKILVILESF